jgi:DNA-directed RNA polymerase sigma subunit (sigma70/sigma32)
VLCVRFCLDNHEPKTLKEVGEQLGLANSRLQSRGDVKSQTISL